MEELADGPHPFTALLDVGLHRTTTGSKVFAAMKVRYFLFPFALHVAYFVCMSLPQGATDGGISIPHSEKRFVGYDSEAKKFNPEVLKKHIFGSHVAEYMKHLKEEDAERFNKQFSKYVKAGIKPEDIEKKWAAVHKAIRANPVHKSTAKPKPKVQKRFHRAGLSYEQRKDRIKQKLASAAKKAAAQ